jgi:hypothetical protein
MTLVNGYQPAGEHSVTFDTGQMSDLASGLYTCRLIAGDRVKTMKMVLMK